MLYPLIMKSCKNLARIEVTPKLEILFSLSDIVALP